MNLRPPSDVTPLRSPWRIAASVAIALGASMPALAQPAAPPPAVVVAAVKDEDVTRSDRFVGRVQALQSVNLVARVEGFLEKVNFKEGSTVKKNDLLMQIEKAPYQAALASAEAQLAAAKSQLAGAQAQLNNAEVVLKRQQDLLKRDVVSQAQADDASANRDVAQAKVQEAQAAIQQAQANVQTAQLNLSYTDIISPIDGRIGLLAITVGNLVTTQSGTIANVAQIDPIRVAFSIPETLFTKVAQTKSGTDAELFTPELTMPDGSKYNHDGKISFASNQIDASTGSLVIYADFPNPNGVLLPGAFVNVIVKEAQGMTMPVVPVSAVLQDSQGRYVFVVNDDNKAETRRIETGPQIENGFPVKQGLTSGETVIVQGLQKVRAGIEVSPTQAPTNTPSVASTSSTPGASGASTSDTASASDASSSSASTSPATTSGTATAGGSDATSSGDSSPAAASADSSDPSPPASTATGDAASSAPATSGHDASTTSSASTGDASANTSTATTQ